MTIEDRYDGLARVLGTLIRASRANLRKTADEFSGGLEQVPYTLLVYLQKYPGARLSEIADAQCVGKGTMSRQLARLEKLDLIERVVDPTDSRGQLVQVTDTAIAKLQVVRARQVARMQAAMTDWDSADVEKLTELLERFVSDFQGTDQFSSPQQEPSHTP